MKPKPAGPLHLRSGLTIYPSQNNAIKTALTELIEQLPARYVLLTDISGQVIMARGHHPDQVDPVALASLVAGDLAANQEIARLLGQYQASQRTLREGETAHTFLAEAGPYLALLVQIDSQTPLGWARVMVLKYAHKLANIVETVPPETRDLRQPSEAQHLLTNDNDLSELFGNALDELWSSS